MKKFGLKKGFFYVLLGALVIFFAYRMIRPMNIFVVSEEFERPMSVTAEPSGLDSLKGSECGVCHSEIYREWSESMHATAWSDPYYQVDFVFDGSQQICLNCHIPLQNQQENMVLGFRDREKFKPILAPNLEFDRELQKEGVTCAVCHVRDPRHNWAIWRY
ncbi:MAG: multiheme c-type cytochrome [Desulfatiglandales bacterium]